MMIIKLNGVSSLFLFHLMDFNYLHEAESFLRS